MGKKNDKRVRLIDSANKLFHQEGVTNTTLAKIAHLAAVPLGNVYYYFKSKESIILAVIERRRQSIETLFKEWESLENPNERLRCLVQRGLQDTQGSAENGDSLGSLCQELSKQGGVVAEAASAIMHDVLNWCEKQFTTLGKAELSRSYALNLVSALQGMSLLSLIFNSPEFIEQQSSYLNHWLESL